MATVNETQINRKAESVAFGFYNCNNFQHFVEFCAMRKLIPSRRSLTAFLKFQGLPNPPTPSEAVVTKEYYERIKSYHK